MIPRTGTRLTLAVLLAATLAGCAARRPPLRTGRAAVAAPPSGRAVAEAAADEHVPDFARKPYEPFSREDAVAIAMREWRLFGQPVDDDPPGTRPTPPPDLKPEREPGLWQRVGEYWWIGQDPGTLESYWTGMHDAFGAVFPAGDDGDFAWSAAFVSYIMRIDGAGARFPYSATHADYINIAREMSLGQTSGYLISAERPDVYAPQPGDLICTGRGPAARIRFDDLPGGRFPSHCDIVVQVAPGTLSVVGGNVDDAVTLKHVPVTQDGLLAGPNGVPVDTRYDWFVVLRVLYEG